MWIFYKSVFTIMKDRKVLSQKNFKNESEEQNMPDLGLLLSMPPEANLQLPDPYLLNYYNDNAERCYWIDGEITENLFEISKNIIRINREDKGIPTEERKPIKLFINSPGGLLEETLGFIGLMDSSKTPIYTINTCTAYSAACLILLSGHKRFAIKNTQALLHSGSGGAIGTFEQAQEQMKNYKDLVDKMRDIILSKTKISTRLYNKNKSKDWYVSTESCLELGIIDRIIDDLDEIL